MNYSSNNLQLIYEMPDDEFEDAEKNTIAICQLLGKESKFHFKKIYVFDFGKNTIKIDWRMSKKGLNIVVMQFQKLNQKKTIWLWQLADI